MKTILFQNQKGGVGKTASAAAVAHIIASEKKQRVLLIDLDPQMNVSNIYSSTDLLSAFESIYMGKIEKLSDTVEDLLLCADKDIHDCIRHTNYDGLDIIPSFLTLSEAEERLKADVAHPQQFRLKNHLRHVENEYDWCIIDTGPSVSILNINGLAAANSVYVPMRCDGGSLLGASITMNLVATVMDYNPSLSIGGLFFTQYRREKNVSKATCAIARDAFGDIVLPEECFIRVSKDVEESSLKQQPVTDYAPKCKASGNYRNLADFILYGEKEKEDVANVEI